MNTEVDIRWKRQSEKDNSETVDYDYGKGNLHFDDSEDIGAIDIFEQVSDFSTLYH